MTRTADPERIYQAWRAAIRNSLEDSGMDRETADRWCDSWEIEAAVEGIKRDADFWDKGKAWIAAERAARRPHW